MPESKKKVNDEKEEEARRKRIEEKEKIWRELIDESKKGEKEEKQETVTDSSKVKETVVEKKPRRLGFRLGSSYTPVIVVVAIILISVLVCWIMVPKLAPTLTEFNTRMGSIATTFSSHSTRMDSIEASIPDISTLVTSTAFNQEVERIGNRIDATEERSNSIEQDILAIQDSIASQVKSKVEYDLTGTFGNYTLSARTSEAGNFTSRLNLVYLPARNVSVVNSTLEEALLSFNSTWLTSLDKNYTPSLVYDGQWKISQVSFLTNKFALVANNITTISINFTGLNVTPDYVFAEVFKVL